MQQPEITSADSPLTDAEVVTRVLAGERHVLSAPDQAPVRDRDASPQPRSFRAARAILRSDDEAEDVMQDAYVRAFQHLGEFRGEARLSTWLTRICVHEALAPLRRSKRHEPDDALADEPAKARDPEQQASDEELRFLLEEAVDRLPETFRAVFVLRAVEQMSTEEVSECLGIPEDTVKTRLFRARGLLREALLARLEDGQTKAFAFFAPRCNRVVEEVLRRIAMH